MTTRRTVSRFCQWLAIALFVCQALAIPSAHAAWDFLWHDAQGRACATRDADPFARLNREHRAESLESSWVLIGQEWFPAVEYAGETWVCRDGSIVPAIERPKTISKLDLLLVLRELDKVDAFFAWLDASGLREFWAAAQLLTTNHPLYAEALASVQEALGLTDEEAAAILARIAK